jgi:hypothetical protein
MNYTPSAKHSRGDGMTRNRSRGDKLSTFNLLAHRKDTYRHQMLIRTESPVVKRASSFGYCAAKPEITR